MRSVARSVANLLDESQDLKQQFRLLDKEAKEKNIKPYQLPEFDRFYARSLARDKQAATLLSTKLEFIEQMAQPSKLLEKIQVYSDRHARYLAIDSIAKSSMTGDRSLLLNSHIPTIDLSKDYAHVTHLASQHHVTAESLSKKIQAFQQHYRQQAWSHLCKEHSLLAEYEKITQESEKKQGYYNERYQKVVHSLATRITSDSLLLNQLKQNHPQIASKLIVQTRHKILHRDF